MERSRALWNVLTLHEGNDDEGDGDLLLLRLLPEHLWEVDEL